MQTPTILTSAALLLTGLLGNDSTSPATKRPTEILPAVDLATAAAAALKAQPGHIVSMELEASEDRDYVVYEFDIVSRKGMFEVEVHGATGEVLESEAEDDEDEELAAYRRVLRHSEKSLVELVASAQQLVHGRAIEAEFGIEDGQPVCEMVLANGRYRVEVEVEARAGHVIEIELIDTLNGEDEEEWGDDDGDEQDEEGEDDEEDEDGDDEDEDEDDDDDGHGRRRDR